MAFATTTLFAGRGGGRGLARRGGASGSSSTASGAASGSWAKAGAVDRQSRAEREGGSETHGRASSKRLGPNLPEGRTLAPPAGGGETARRAQKRSSMRAGSTETPVRLAAASSIGMTSSTRSATR